MKQHRVEYRIVPWVGGRWRVELRVDDLVDEKAYFDSRAACVRWGEMKVAERRGVRA